MNSLIESEFPLREAQHVRYQLMDVLTDRDLEYKLPGDNPTLGELCREMGELEHSYIQSFVTLRQDWLYRNSEPDLARSVERLTAWYIALDEEFEQVIRRFSEDELHSTLIDRGRGVTVSAYVQFQIYREALMMFFAKASVYLKALQKFVSDEWQVGIG